jgi:radical SAM superfamily enzyme YgiQ (UPF0313 family)
MISISTLRQRGQAPRPDACNALLVYPRFNPNSFWNYQATCEIVGAKNSSAPLGLITVAALLPASWQLKFVNRNTESLDERDLAWADVVLTGGMLPQQRDTLRVIAEAHAHGKPVVVGGPDATSSPHVYADADFQVLGEAEGVIDEFLDAWSTGAERGVFQARGFPDVTKTPIPRFDLLKFDQYLNVGVQFSRGCPFNCEFCDIIELYGRVPRTKTDAQMTQELDALYALGYRGHVDFVDDNLIGNKRRVKEFLPHLRGWLRAHGDPFEFSTEATINLADDAELLTLMRDTNFFSVFIGIESPDTDTLLHMQKPQNTRRVIQESVQRIYRAGLLVHAGFIFGFDTERDGAAGQMIACIDDTAIPVCMVGLLYALPNTQLTRRLLKEGRLHPDHDRSLTDEDADQCTAGLNFRTLRPRRDVLADYRTVLDRVYGPADYFARVRRVGRQLDCSQRRFTVRLRHAWRDARAFVRMAWRLGVRDADVRRHFWITFADCVWRNPRAIRYVGSFSALYLHFGPFARLVSARITREIDALSAVEADTGEVLQSGGGRRRAGAETHPT